MITKANAVAPTGDTSPLFFIELGKKRPRITVITVITVSKCNYLSWSFPAKSK